MSASVLSQLLMWGGRAKTQPTPIPIHEYRGFTTRKKLRQKFRMVHGMDLDSHSPKSQSLSLSYGPNLPTSLTHFIPETRGFKPWRPAAVMGTSRGANKNCFSIFPGSSSAHRTLKKLRAFPTWQPYLRTSRFQGCQIVNKKRKLLSEQMLNLPRALALPQYYPRPSSGILTWFPFSWRGENHPLIKRIIQSFRND